MGDIKCILKKSIIDSLKKIKSFRYISAALMVFTLSLADTSGIDRLISDIGENITIGIVPHVMSDKYFSTFYGLVVCYLLSEIPYFNSGELFYITRMGRKKWFFSKILSIVILMFIFTVTTFLICIAVFFPHISFSNEWGKVIITMAYGNISHDLICMPTMDVIYAFSPLQAIAVNFLMVWLVTTMMGIAMFALSIYFGRGVSIVTALVSVTLALSDMLYISIKILPYLSVSLWYRISKYGANISYDMYYPHMRSYVMLASIICVVCLVLSAIKIKHTEFDWINES